MSKEQLPAARGGWIGVLLGIGLVVVQARLSGTAILDLAFRIPQDPVVLLGKILIIGSALILVCPKFKPCRQTAPRHGP